MCRPLLLPLLVLPILICLSAFAQGPSISYKKLDESLAYDFGNEFGFSALVADEDDFLFNKSYGHLDSLGSKKVNSNALFHIASINKSVTAVGIFILMEKKQLNLDDTIGKFFKSVPGDKQTTGNRMISDYIADYLFE